MAIFKIHFSFFNFLHHDCQTGRKTLGGGGDHVLAGSHKQLSVAQLICCKFHYSPWHYTNGSTPKDSWDLPRHCCVWGAKLQPECELKIHSITGKGDAFSIHLSLVENTSNILKAVKYQLHITIQKFSKSKWTEVKWTLEWIACVYFQHAPAYFF